MHPIERLRYVARSTGAPQEVLVRETAGALASLGFDPPGLVTACRRILDRHPLSGPLWWLSARVLTAHDPMDEAWRAADEIGADDTAGVLAYDLPDDATRAQQIAQRLEGAAPFALPGVRATRLARSDTDWLAGDVRTVRLVAARLEARLTGGALYTIGPEAAALAQESLLALVPVLEALRGTIHAACPSRAPSAAQDAA